VRSTLQCSQYRVTAPQREKVRDIAALLGVSASEIVRRAIEAYDPHAAGKDDKALQQATPLIADASARLSEALERLDAGLTRLADPQEEERLRETARAAIQADPELIAGMRRLLGGRREAVGL